MLLTKKKTINIDELIKQEDIKTSSEISQQPSNSPSITEEEVKRNRYYLPILNINYTEQWPTKPLEERKHFTDKVAFETCLGNCCGVKGLKGGCCQMDPYDMEHVLGPIDEEWIEDTIKWFRKKGITMGRADLVIDYEEGKVIGDNLFKECSTNNVFQQLDAYPIMRFQAYGPRYACKFMNPETNMCNIYHIRPKMCRTYYCQYVVTNFLVKTKHYKPNTWRKLR